MTEHAGPERRCATRSTSAGSAPTSASSWATPINIVVGPLLARSPHVVYTNIVEALLRFVLVSRGRMLLHSACVELDGVGVMLSALTDTGKTATVLRLLRDHGGAFLSDDMTVVDADGNGGVLPQAADHQLAHAARGERQRPDPEGVAPAAVPEPPALQGRPLAGADTGPVQPADHGHQRAHPDDGAAAEVHGRPAGALPDRHVDHGRASCSSSSGARPGIADLDHASDARADDRQHRRRVRLPAVPVPRPGDHRRRAGVPAAAPAGAGDPGGLPVQRAYPGGRLGQLRLGRRDPAAARRGRTGPASSRCPVR